MEVCLCLVYILIGGTSASEFCHVQGFNPPICIAGLQ